jgi:hypothetical protein
MRLNDYNLYAKYFLNTQNMTRAWAEWNPYIIGGVSQVTRSHTQPNQVINNKDTSGSFDLGAGVEYLINNKKNYVGFYLIYQYITYPGEGNKLPNPVVNGGGNTKFSQSGDPLTLMATIGINF